MKKYISVSMNGLARITAKTPDFIIGLGTHNLKTCIAVFIYNDKLISVVHVDIATDLQSLLDEVKIIGKNSKIILVHNSVKRDAAHDWLESIGRGQETSILKNVLNFLQANLPQIKPTVLDSPDGDAYLNRKGILSLDGNKLSDEVVFVPQTRLRYAIHYLNPLFLQQMRKATLEFDGESYCDIPALCDPARKIVATIRPDLRNLNLAENEMNIADYLEREVISKLTIKRIKEDLVALKKHLTTAFTIILNNAISIRHYNNRPCFFQTGNTIKIIYDTAGKSYAARLSYCIKNIDSDEEKNLAAEYKRNKDFENEYLIPENDGHNNQMILPIFWLKQLKPSAIAELAREFKIDHESFSETIRMQQ